VVTEPLQDLADEPVIRAIEAHSRARAIAWGGLAGARVEDSGDMVLFISPLPVSWASGVEGARLNRRNADARIRHAVDAFRNAGASATWSVGPLTTPADLPDRLLAHGFRLDHDLPWMAADLALLPPLARPQELEIQRVTSRALHEAWLTAMVEGFESNDNQDSRLTLDTLGRRDPNRREGPWVRFAGRFQGRPVASSGLILAGGIAGVYNVATLPAFRRRGFGGAMTHAAMRHARTLEYRVAVLGTSELGRGVYERLGFRDVCTSRDYLWEPSAPAEVGLIVSSAARPSS